MALIWIMRQPYKKASLTSGNSHDGHQSWKQYYVLKYSSQQPLCNGRRLAYYWSHNKYLAAKCLKKKHSALTHEVFIEEHSFGCPVNGQVWCNDITV